MFLVITLIYFVLISCFVTGFCVACNQKHSIYLYTLYIFLLFFLLSFLPASKSKFKPQSCLLFCWSHQCFAKVREELLLSFMTVVWIKVVNSVNKCNTNLLIWFLPDWAVFVVLFYTTWKVKSCCFLSYLGCSIAHVQWTFYLRSYTSKLWRQLHHCLSGEPRFLLSVFSREHTKSHGTSWQH